MEVEDDSHSCWRLVGSWISEGMELEDDSPAEAVGDSGWMGILEVEEET